MEVQDGVVLQGGFYEKYEEGEMPFEEVTAQVLADETNMGRGFTSYDLISRTLHQLARDGNHQVLAMALDRLGDQCRRRINQLDDLKMAPLHYAARYSHPFTVLTLLQRKAEINIRGQNDVTPLHCAARYRKSIHSAAKKRKHAKFRSKELVTFQDVESGSKGEEEREDEEEGANTEEGDGEEEEEKENGSDVEPSDDVKRTSISEYEDMDNLESVVKVLVENGADVDARDVYGLSALHYAAMRGHDVAARDLLAYGHVDIEARDKQQMTPLFIAATYGYTDICSRLIKNGADIIALDESQQSTLHRAAAEGHLEIVELLLNTASEEGGDAKVEKFLGIRDIERQTALHLAVMNGNTETAKLLMSKGVDVNVVKDTLATPLHAAAAIGDEELITLLIEHGANVEAVDCHQQTPLHKAAASNQSAAISILLDHNAKIERKDKDSFTPFLLAAASGNPEALTALMEKGAFVDVFDKDDKTAIFWCAELGHVECLKRLLEDEESATLVDFSNRLDNSPLHEAARKGNVEVVKLLLSKGSKIDNKNEDEDTALHIAAENGQTEVVKELIKNFRFLINDENEDGDSPLHLASLHGRTEVVEVLLEANADVEARNTVLWTPLDCASANGHLTICKLLLDHDSPLDPLDKTKTTPLQLAAERGHVEVTKLLLDKGASVSVVDSSYKNALEVAVTAGQRDVAMTIVKSSQWLEAMRNARSDPSTKRKITPFRLLIQRLPDVAKVVLDRCITTNGKDTEEEDYGIKFNFEFVDDTYIMTSSIEENSEDSISVISASSYESPFDEYGRLYEEADPYTTDTRLLKRNHPLMMMVRYKRTGLLGHPVSVSLLKHKWLSYARFVYYFNLLFYVVFLTFITGYICNSADWKYIEYLMKQNNLTIPSSGVTCKEAEELGALGDEMFIMAGKWVIIVMTCLNILRELFQIYQSRLNYLGIENLVEWVCYIGALLLVIDWTGSSQCYVRETWQWQVGSVVIFLAWLNLVLFLRKLPLFGIYVVMFTDIFATFSRFFIVFFLFIVGFGLSFFMIFRTQLPFEYVGTSLLKTSVMMVGEFEYDSIFSNEEFPLEYPFVSYLLFVFFLILMSIIVMNLLIGLAVDDIKEVQDQAALKRRAMQTQLILDVEAIIPESLRRYFATSFRKFYPNKKRSTIKKIFSDFNLLHNFDYSQTATKEENEEETRRSLEALREELSDLKAQNQKMFSLVAASLTFNTRMRRLENRILEKE